MKLVLIGCYLFSVVQFVITTTATHQPSLPQPVDDAGAFPGHLEPLGAQQNKVDIETLTEYPTPQDFFEKYVKPGRPFLLKGGAKYQKAYDVWSDDYLKRNPEAASELVRVEPNKKEVRNATGFEISFEEFIERYKDEKIYMVNQVPKFLQKDVMMPPPLRCNNTRTLMIDHVTWISSGGTKSVLHYDSMDNINCLFRGTKDLLFINPIKYGSKVPIDNPTNGYSSLDVDKRVCAYYYRVDFTKYPSMRYVEYVQCHMDQGDCLFIPYGWYHQVNSVANEHHQNIAVNIWFQHSQHHVPAGNCDLPEEEASIDHFAFYGVDNLYGGMDEEEETGNEGENDDGAEMDDPFRNLDDFAWSLDHTKYQRAGFKTFCSLLKKVPKLVTAEHIDHLQLSIEFLESAKLMFDALNVDGDKFLTKDDINTLKQSEDAKRINDLCSEQLRVLELISHSLLLEQPSPSAKEASNNAQEERQESLQNKKKEEL